MQPVLQGDEWAVAVQAGYLNFSGGWKDAWESHKAAGKEMRPDYFLGDGGL